MLWPAAASSACPATCSTKLPYEAKIELLEAENDLALAVDRLDEAHNEIGRTRDQIRRAKDRRSAAEREVGSGEDAALAKTSPSWPSTKPSERVEWLRAQPAGQRARKRISPSRTCTAPRRRFELARLTAARKAKLEGSRAARPEASSSNRSRTARRRTQALKEKLKESNAEAAQLRADWDQARAALAKKTFDARASPFVE